MTIKSLVACINAERQYDVFAQADRLLPAGRYFGGSLPDDIATLLTAVAQGSPKQR